MHRRHHAFTDEPGDPHSPWLEGFWTVQVGNVVLYRRSARDGETVDRYAKDLPRDRWDRILFDHSLLGLGVGIGVLSLIFWGDWMLVAIAAAVHVVTYLALNSAVNAVGHTYGSRSFDGLATNSQWLAFMTGGEGLHSNHHAAPTSARLSFRPRRVRPVVEVHHAGTAIALARGATRQAPLLRSLAPRGASRIASVPLLVLSDRLEPHGSKRTSTRGIEIMDIISALFAENIDLRPVPGPSTRIDISGVMFSLPAPSEPPVALTPHLIVIVRCRSDEDGQGLLEVLFRDEQGEQVARNVSPFQVEPGKFTYRLVRGELEFQHYGTIEAHCRLLPDGPVTAVPLTLLPPI